MKSGYKTTEFWVTIFSNVVAVLVAFDVIGVNESGAVAQVAAMIAASIVTATYNNSRGKVKTAEQQIVG